MTATSTYTDLFNQLVRAEIELWNALEAHLASDAGVTVSQFQALSAVAGIDGPARVQDISERMSITVGATSKLVDRLERSGYATRQANPADRRSSIVALTNAGRSALRVAESVAEARLRSMLGASVSPDAATALTSQLAAIRGAAGEASA